MTVCSIVRLDALMRRTHGRPEIAVGLIDGPVAHPHPALPAERLRPVGTHPPHCRCGDAHACRHGTFVAAMLIGRPEHGALGLCPGVTLLVRPVYPDCVTSASTTPTELARAVHDCLDAGARILSISSAPAGTNRRPHPLLARALDRAATTGALVVVAAGNRPGVVGGVLTGHPWTIPVTGCRADGCPSPRSSLSLATARHGLSAPAERVPGPDPSGRPVLLDGTSVAVPFVTATAALLWSLHPDAPATQIRAALLGGARRTRLTPPLLDAEAAWHRLEGGGHRVRPAA